jgi:hypothetical protein
MQRLYPFLKWLTGIVFVVIGGGLLSTFIYDWLTKPESSAAHWQLIIDHWPWLAAPMTALLALATWGYFADKKYRAREAAKLDDAEPPAAVFERIENSSNSQQANVTGNQNVVLQPQGSGSTTVNINSSNNSAPGRLVHMQIDAPPYDFTGREEELQELVDAVRKGGTTISGLRGMGGIGKTALAQKIAQILKPDFPDGQIYLDLKGAKHEEDDGQNVQPLTPTEGLGRIVTSFGHEVNLNATVDERTGLYRSILANKRVLLLMDNARDEQQVKPIIPPAGSVLVVTSRPNFTLPGLFAKKLETLPPARACELLLKIEPRIGGDAAEIAGLCGYLPLALRTAASALQNRKDLSPAEFLRKLKDAEGRVRETGVELALTTNSELLDPALRDRWFQLGVFPGIFEPMGVAAVWECAPEVAKDALSDLLRYSLIEWNSATSRYRLHDLVRDFTTLRLEELNTTHAGGVAALAPLCSKRPDLPPLKLYGHQAEFQAANHAAFGPLRPGSIACVAEMVK